MDIKAKPYIKMTDDEARQAVIECVRDVARPGVKVQSIHDALKLRLGVNTVDLRFLPPPERGRLKSPDGNGRIRFMFSAVGPGRGTIRGGDTI